MARSKISLRELYRLFSALVPVMTAKQVKIVCLDAVRRPFVQCRLFVALQCRVQRLSHGLRDIGLDFEYV